MILKSPFFLPFNFMLRSQLLSAVLSSYLTPYALLWEHDTYFIVAKTIRVQAGFEHFASGISQHLYNITYLMFASL